MSNEKSLDNFVSRSNIRYNHLLRETIERLKIENWDEFNEHDCSFCKDVEDCDLCYIKYPYIHNICKSYGANELDIFNEAKEIIELLEEELENVD